MQKQEQGNQSSLNCHQNIKNKYKCNKTSTINVGVLSLTKITVLFLKVTTLLSLYRGVKSATSKTQIRSRRRSIGELLVMSSWYGSLRYSIYITCSRCRGEQDL